MKLFIDSSTNYLYLAAENKGSYHHFVRYGKNDHSETMMDFVDSFIEDNSFTYDDLEAIFIGRGPGSYTGLRIAGVIGKVMAYLKNVPLYSFSSLDISLAWVYNHPTLVKYKSITPAKKNYSYAKIFSITNNKLMVVDDEMFIENQELEEKYYDYHTIEITEELLNSDDIAANILKYKMYEKEDALEYSPNYLRSGI